MDEFFNMQAFKATLEISGRPKSPLRVTNFLHSAITKPPTQPQPDVRPSLPEKAPNPITFCTHDKFKSMIDRLLL